MQHFKVRGCGFVVPQGFLPKLVCLQADEQVERECSLKQRATGFADLREEFLCRSEILKVPIEVVDQRIARTVALRALWTLPSASDKPFVPSLTWRGSFQGWLFQNGPEGVGYYMDSFVNAALRVPVEFLIASDSPSEGPRTERKRGGRSHRSRRPQ